MSDLLYVTGAGNTVSRTAGGSLNSALNLSCLSFSFLMHASSHGRLEQQHAAQHALVDEEPHACVPVMLCCRVSHVCPAVDDGSNNNNLGLVDISSDYFNANVEFTQSSNNTLLGMSLLPSSGAASAVYHVYNANSACAANVTQTQSDYFLQTTRL